MGIADLAAPGILARLRPTLAAYDISVGPTLQRVGTVVPAGKRRECSISAYTVGAAAAVLSALAAGAAWPSVAEAQAAGQNYDTTVRSFAIGGRDWLRSQLVLHAVSVLGFQALLVNNRGAAVGAPSEVLHSRSYSNLTAGTNNKTVSVGRDGRVVASQSASPYLVSSVWNPGAGFGTPRVPAAAPFGTTVPTSIAVSPDGLKVAVGSSASPFLAVYGLNADGTWGSQWAVPGTLPNGAVQDIAWSPGSDVVIITTGTTPFLEAYAVTGSAFGAKFASATALTGSPQGMQAHPTTNWIAVATNGTVNYAYPFTSSAWGAQVTHTLPVTGSYDVAFSPSGARIVYGLLGASQPPEYVYDFNTSTGAITNQLASAVATLPNSPRTIGWIDDDLVIGTFASATATDRYLRRLGTYGTDGLTTGNPRRLGDLLVPAGAGAGALGTPVFSQFSLAAGELLVLSAPPPGVVVHVETREYLA